MSASTSALHALGQSIWYDNISRQMLDNGELASMIAKGEIRGITSNPSIFRNAIANSHDYDPALVPMAWAGWSAEQIYEQLAIEDIRAACDLFQPLYQDTDGGDGYVSLEVSPRLAHDTLGTVAAAQRLWKMVDRCNLLIKIPATLEGLPAVRQTIAAGLNVNVTLIFSLSRYQQVMEAYLTGLEDRLAKGQPIDRIASVASFFVSRIDKKADALAPHLKGKIAIANARLAYQSFRQVFEGTRFAALRAKGARVQRPLWASTSTKHNPDLPKAMYVENLIGPHTVNTVPPIAFEVFRTHGKASLTLEANLPEARQAFDNLAAAGVSIDQITRELEEEGVKAFTDDYEALLNTIDARRDPITAQLGALGSAVAARIAQFDRDSVAARVWEGDASLWTDDPKGQAEIKRRLGWLHLPETSRPYLVELKKFVIDNRKAGIDHVLLLGMGGSSLAPEVLSLIFGQLEASTRGVTFAILDSTDPGQVSATARRFPVERTLFIVSSKSGGTAEVNAFLDFFWARARRKLGQKAARHFIAITDPGTSLDKLAGERKFLHTFSADPNVGGRFSALSLFGLVPAALIGIDVEKFLTRAAFMAAQCTKDMPAARNPGLVLGAILGEAALQGRDKLTLITDAPCASFGSWLEQLVAESSGKSGKGIVPIDLEPPAAPEVYGSDRLFVYFRTTGQHEGAVNRLLDAGSPVLTIPINDPYDLSAEFYRWEFATTVACAILHINAFDQPDVQDSKDRTKAKIQEYLDTGKLVEGKTVSWEDQPALRAFLKQVKPGDYVALNAYLPRNRQTAALLRRLRLAIRRHTGCATTVGFGPRFLHSTGQLHKGGAGNGVFLQITADPVNDIAIPEEPLTFGTLERAQALGDLEALHGRGRRALRVHLPSPILLKKLVEGVEEFAAEQQKMRLK
jgi:transaldolase/glucose-6-phosphate isomerase